MDEQTKQKHIQDLYQEWIPMIHYHAESAHKNYPDRVKSPGDLYEAGLMGLMSAFKDFNPDLAAKKGTSFKTYASSKIKGIMQDHITGLHSFGAEGAFDPHWEQKSRSFAAEQKAKQPQAAQPTEEPPAIPKEATKITPGRP
jgi:DNA-directed RNA polymerase specialized sigma subunit